MSDNIIGFTMVLFFLAFIGGIIWFAVYMQRKLYKKTWDNYALIADQLGIPAPDTADTKLVRTMPYLTGTTKGINFLTRMEIRGSGKNRSYYTVFSWEIKSAGSNTITIYREHFFAKIGKAFGMQDIQTGIESFDKKFIFRSNNEEYARQIFTDRLCALMEEGAADMHAGFYIKNGRLSYEEQGYLNTNEKCARFLRLITLSRSIVDAIERPHASHFATHTTV